MKALPRQGTQEVWYQVNFYQEKQSPIHKNILTYALLCLSWFNSSWQLSTTEPIPEKTPGLSQWQFNGWRKSCMHKQSRARSSFSTSQVGVQPCPGLWGPSHVTAPWEDQGIIGECHPKHNSFPLLSCRFMCSAWCSVVWNVPLAIWVSCPGSAPSQPAGLLLTGRAGNLESLA